jgi:glycosyltransferase involved in cell wall biosynthesis
MTRFVGIKHNRICVVSDILFNNEGLNIVEIPPELSHISPSEIIANCIIKNGKIKYKHLKKPTKELKVALVGNWKMRCGIATYSEHLWPEITKHIGDVKLFIEKNDICTGNIYQLGNQILSEDQVSVCWKRGEPLQDLVNGLQDYDPDVILIQHEFGLWSNARHWLSMMTELSDYRIIVVMHSVFPEHQDKIIFEAAVPEIIVHLQDAKDNLENVKKINAKVHVIPHGCYQAGDQKKLWNNYKSQHTFVQQGFGFTYKNFASSIRATALLKPKYPDIFFTALFSESPHAKMDHQMYYNELSRLVKELELQENVAIIRGFQSDNVVNTYLRSNQVAVFPYLSVPGHEVFGASGAARLAMAAGVPIISSNLAHFSDLPTIRADTPECIAEELDKLFCDATLRKQQIEKQNQFIIDNSWANVAKRFIDIFASFDKV